MACRGHMRNREGGKERGNGEKKRDQPLLTSMWPHHIVDSYDPYVLTSC
jgi:hypothetical protein